MFMNRLKIIHKCNCNLKRLPLKSSQLCSTINLKPLTRSTSDAPLQYVHGYENGQIVSGIYNPSYDRKEWLRWHCSASLFFNGALRPFRGFLIPLYTTSGPISHLFRIMLGHSVSKHLQNDMEICIFHRVPDFRLWNNTNIPFNFERSVKLVWTFVRNLFSSFYIRCTLIHHYTFATYGCTFFLEIFLKWLKFVLMTNVPVMLLTVLVQ